MTPPTYIALKIEKSHDVIRCFPPLGQFGPVYRANRQTEHVCVPVALKPIKSALSSETDVGKFLREMAILKCIRHPNIAQVYGVVNEG